jgi:large repetitive protein
MPKIINVHAQNGDNVILLGQSLNDTLIAGSGRQMLYGNAGNDKIVGGAGAQTLDGGSGNDYVEAGLGDQSIRGGSGRDIIDFSHLSGSLDIDPDLYVATLVTPGNGASQQHYGLSGFETIMTTQQNDVIHASANTPRTYYGLGGSDHFFSESGGDTLIGGSGSDAYTWMKKYVDVGHADEIKDFQIHSDHLDLSDFLKGQTIKHPQYADVVRLVAHDAVHGDEQTMVQTLVHGAWHDTVLLDHVATTAVTLHDLLFG